MVGAVAEGLPEEEVDSEETEGVEEILEEGGGVALILAVADVVETQISQDLQEAFEDGVHRHTYGVAVLRAMWSLK